VKLEERQCGFEVSCVQESCGSCRNYSKRVPRYDVETTAITITLVNRINIHYRELPRPWSCHLRLEYILSFTAEWDILHPPRLLTVRLYHDRVIYTVPGERSERSALMCLARAF
jgi:hypothetical protein